MNQSVPASQILRESSSYDTVGNAYFAATIHAWPLQWRHVAVVTSAFHMPRSQAIFEHVFELLDRSSSSGHLRCVADVEIDGAAVCRQLARFPGHTSAHMETGPVPIRILRRHTLLIRLEISTCGHHRACV